MSTIELAQEELARIFPDFIIGSVRAELKTDPLTTYVEPVPGLLVALQSPVWQIVYGRRGSGKTHLLLALRQQLNDRGRLASYINLQSAVLSPPAAAVHQEDWRPSAAFSGLASNLARFVIDVADSSASAGGRNPELEDLALAISDASEYVQPDVEPDLVRLGRLLSQFVEASPHPQLTLLLDEWASLGPARSQGRFAEYLRVCLGPHSNLTVKVATNRLNTHLGTGTAGRQTGLEVGADIFVAGDLDAAVVAHDVRADFAANVLLRHLGVCGGGVSGWFPRDRGELVDSFFRDPQSFATLVEGSGGLTRSLIVLFQWLGRMKPPGRGVRWTTPEVEDVVVEGARDLHHLSGEPAQLIGNLARLLWRRGDRVFAVNVDDWDAVLDDLLDGRAIHDVSVQVIEPGSRSAWRALEIDYGLWLDLARHDERKAATGLGHRNSSGPRDPVALELPELRDLIVQQIITCPNCMVRFPKAAPAFAVRRLCPSCFEEWHA